MNGDIKDQAVHVTWRGSEITLKVLKALILEMLKNHNQMKHGEQSLKKLNLQNKQLESVKITQSDIRQFRGELKNHAVDFNIKKDKETGEFNVFFKAQDVDRVYKGLEKVVKDFDKTKKPVKETVEQAKQKAEERTANREAPDKKRSVDRGHDER